VEVNSDDAQTLGVKDGDKVSVSAGNAAMKAPAKVSDAVPAGVVFVPNNFRGAPVNAVLGYGNSRRVEVKKG
jgi:anaerobic selenocysteine-containing dehydrogenase